MNNKTTDDLVLEEESERESEGEGGGRANGRARFVLTGYHCATEKQNQRGSGRRFITDHLFVFCLCALAGLVVRCCNIFLLFLFYLRGKGRG